MVSNPKCYSKSGGVSHERSTAGLFFEKQQDVSQARETEGMGDL